VTQTDMTEQDLPAHIVDIVQRMAHLHGRHHNDVSPAQRFVERVTRLFGRPTAVLVFCGVAAAWMVLNSFGIIPGIRFVDPPPFAWLELGATLSSFLLVVLVLATQRREDQLAKLREQLILQLAIASDQKMAKVIALLDEIRRDSPHLDDRDDHEAGAMAKSADPHKVLDAIKETHEEAERGDEES
jgi:uncharacterized membrane protein